MFTAAADSAGGCASAALCDDFEAATLNPAWEIQVSSTPQPALDSTRVHGGSKALKVVGGSSQSFVIADVPGQAFYVRAYMNFEKKRLPKHIPPMNVPRSTPMETADDPTMRLRS